MFYRQVKSQSSVLSHFSCVRFFATLCTVALQAPLSLGFCRQKYWSGLSCQPPGDFPDPGIKLKSHVSSALLGRCDQPFINLIED